MGNNKHELFLHWSWIEPPFSSSPLSKIKWSRFSPWHVYTCEFLTSCIFLPLNFRQHWGSTRVGFIWDQFKAAPNQKCLQRFLRATTQTPHQQPVPTRKYETTKHQNYKTSKLPHHPWWFLCHFSGWYLPALRDFVFSSKWHIWMHQLAMSENNLGLHGLISDNDSEQWLQYIGSNYVPQLQVNEHSCLSCIW